MKPSSQSGKTGRFHPDQRQRVSRTLLCSPDKLQLKITACICCMCSHCHPYHLHMFTLSSLPSTYVHSVIPTIYMCSHCHPYHLHVFTLSSLPSACVHTIVTTISMRSHHRHYYLHVFTPPSLPSALALYLLYLHVATSDWLHVASPV